MRPKPMSESEVTAKQTVTIDHSLDPSQLRWVRNEFVYFLDIPWTQSVGGRLPGSSDDPAAGLSVRELTFGLLESIMEVSIPIDILSRDKMDRLVISGAELSRLLVPWARAHSDPNTSSPAYARAEQGERVKRALIAATSRLDHAVYASPDTLTCTCPDALSNVVCALATFLVSLSHCAKAIWGEDDAFHFLERHTRLYGEVAHVLRSKLERTWHDRAADEMERVLAAGIPFAAYTVHSVPTRNNVHSVDTSNYMPQHVTKECTCSFVKAPMDSISELLTQGEVPVLVFNGQELLVRRASEGSYLAISHVWADGLGSTTEDGLPRCQLERLADLARKLIPDGAFWQDGLCVPEEKMLRRRAIGLMARTYIDADKVLVLDSGVRSQCAFSTPKEECLLRIATCGWMQRIWTLQEGMLARELYFEVSDGLIECTAFNGAPSRLALHLLPLLHYRRKDGSGTDFQTRLPELPRCDINDVIALLRYRTTSHPADEPVAIAGLLGVDAGELVPFNTLEERMKALLTHVRQVPRHLAVFGWFCSRLRAPNFSWAPESLTSIIWPGDKDDPRVATCTEEGLFGEYGVILLPETELSIHCGVFATVVEEEEEYTGEAAHQGCTPPETASRATFNLVLSNPFFLSLPRESTGTLTFNGLLMNRSSLTESMHEEGVGVVRFSDVRGPRMSKENGEPMVCTFVAAGSARRGMPDTVETTRTRAHWHAVNVRMLGYKLVQVI